MSNAAWMMNFLLMLASFGTPYTPGSSVSEFDFNENGQIDVFDILDMLAMKPSPFDMGQDQEFK